MLLKSLESFFLINHDIDPAYCYSAPGLTWQCGFKHTKINLDLLTNYDMLLMFENGIRGGCSGVLGDRYVKANNKYVPLDSTKLTTQSEDSNEKRTKQCQSNNLYGWAMSQKLPTGDFKWEGSTS